MDGSVLKCQFVHQRIQENGHDRENPWNHELLRVRGSKQCFGASSHFLKLPVIGWHITIKIIVCLSLAGTVCYLFYSPLLAIWVLGPSICDLPVISLWCSDNPRKMSPNSFPGRKWELKTNIWHIFIHTFCNGCLRTPPPLVFDDDGGVILTIK